MTVSLDGNSLTINKLVNVARDNENIEVTKESWKRIEDCRTMLQSKIEAHETMYGITTGIGEFSEVTLTPDQTQEFQKFLVRNHAAGIGDPMDIEIANMLRTSGRDFYLLVNKVDSEKNEIGFDEDDF